jgi:isopenicillin-N epimerase
VPVFIDGAHGLGSLPLNLSTLGADFYVGNCHKWYCCTPGCAFLYVRKPSRDGHGAVPLGRLEVVEGVAGEQNDASSHVIHPLIISHGFGEGFTSNFIWSGYCDYSSVLTFPAVLEFWKRIGLERVWEYNTGLLLQVVELLRHRWNAHVCQPPFVTC